MTVERKKEAKAASGFDPERQLRNALALSSIRRASSGLRLGSNSYIPNSLMALYHTASLQHLKKISDYIEVGQEVWYKADECGLAFYDGQDERPETLQLGPRKSNFR